MGTKLNNGLWNKIKESEYKMSTNNFNVSTQYFSDFPGMSLRHSRGLKEVVGFGLDSSSRGKASFFNISDKTRNEFIFSKCFYFSFGKILYICDSDLLCDKIKELAWEHDVEKIDCFTYEMYNTNASIWNRKYDIVILDQCDYLFSADRTVSGEDFLRTVIQNHKLSTRAYTSDCPLNCIEKIYMIEKKLNCDEQDYQHMSVLNIIDEN